MSDTHDRLDLINEKLNRLIEAQTQLHDTIYGFIDAHRATFTVIEVANKFDLLARLSPSTRLHVCERATLKLFGDPYYVKPFGYEHDQYVYDAVDLPAIYSAVVSARSDVKAEEA